MSISHTLPETLNSSHYSKMHLWRKFHLLCSEGALGIAYKGLWLISTRALNTSVGTFQEDLRFP